MTDIAIENVVAHTVALLTGYEFELKGYTADEIVGEWLKEYEAVWLRLAVIEALYQGRYKSISVEQILRSWLRRGHPNFHFNHEFECLICSKLPRSVAAFEENPLVKGFSQRKSVSETRISNQSDHLNLKLPQLNPAHPPKSTKSSSDQPKTVTCCCGAEQKKSEVVDAKKEKEKKEKNYQNKALKPENSSPEPKIPPKTPNSQSKGFISPIHQLTPKEDASRLYSKLQAVAHKNFEHEDELNN